MTWTTVKLLKLKQKVLLPSPVSPTHALCSFIHVNAKACVVIYYSTDTGELKEENKTEGLIYFHVLSPCLMAVFFKGTARMYIVFYLHSSWKSINKTWIKRWILIIMHWCFHSTGRLNWLDAIWWEKKTTTNKFQLISFTRWSAVKFNRILKQFKMSKSRFKIKQSSAAQFKSSLSLVNPDFVK